MNHSLEVAGKVLLFGRRGYGFAITPLSLRDISPCRGISSTATDCSQAGRVLPLPSCFPRLRIANCELRIKQKNSTPQCKTHWGWSNNSTVPPRLSAVRPSRCLNAAYGPCGLLGNVLGSSLTVRCFQPRHLSLYGKSCLLFSVVAFGLLYMIKTWD